MTASNSIIYSAGPIDNEFGPFEAVQVLTKYLNCNSFVNIDVGLKDFSLDGTLTLVDNQIFT
jgi:hypothetical protein